MKKEYRFHIEENFRVDSLALGIKNRLAQKDVNIETEELDGRKYLLTISDMEGREKGFLERKSSKYFSFSVLLEQRENELFVYFRENRTNIGSSLWNPLILLTLGSIKARVEELEKQIIEYIQDVVLEEEVSLKSMNIKQRIICATPLISLILFLSMGFIWNLWGYGSLAFLLIPLMPILLGEVNPEYVFPLVVAGIYVGLGFGFGLWHPAWIIFLTIPVYYILFPVKNRRRLMKKYEY